MPRLLPPTATVANVVVIAVVAVVVVVVVIFGIAVIVVVVVVIAEPPALPQAVVNKPFARVTYTDAVSMLQEEIGKDRSKWEFPDVEFGTDLASEHEVSLHHRHHVVFSWS